MECHAAEKQCGGGFCVMRQSNCQGARLSEKNSPSPQRQLAVSCVSLGSISSLILNARFCICADGIGPGMFFCGLSFLPHPFAVFLRTFRVDELRSGLFFLPAVWRCPARRHPAAGLLP